MGSIVAIYGGRGIRGALAYVLGSGKGSGNGIPKIIDRLDVAGLTPREISKEFGFYRQLAGPGKDVFNIAFSWRREEQPSREMRVAYARDWAEEMGLKETPRIMVEHLDSDHLNDHLVGLYLNEKGERIKHAWDWNRSNLVCAKLDEKYGLQVENRVRPGKEKPHPELPQIPKPPTPPDVPDGKHEIAKISFGEALLRSKANGGTFPALEAALKDVGLRLYWVFRKGTHEIRGIEVIANDGTHFPASDLKRDWSFQNLKKKHGISGEPDANPRLESGHDIAPNGGVSIPIAKPHTPPIRPEDRGDVSCLPENALPRLAKTAPSAHRKSLSRWDPEVIFGGVQPTLRQVQFRSPEWVAPRGRGIPPGLTPLGSRLAGTHRGPIVETTHQSGMGSGLASSGPDGKGTPLSIPALPKSLSHLLVAGDLVDSGFELVDFTAVWNPHPGPSGPHPPRRGNIEFGSTRVGLEPSGYGQHPATAQSRGSGSEKALHLGVEGVDFRPRQFQEGSLDPDNCARDLDLEALMAEIPKAPRNNPKKQSSLPLDVWIPDQSRGPKPPDPGSPKHVPRQRFRR